MSVANGANDDKRPEIFVVVPSYNHAPFIEKCLNSIFSQTLRPNKLLVIDDGSSDDSPKLIEKVLRDSPFDTELIVRENRGLCRTLNEGLTTSSGEYFAYIGSDDLWLPNFLAERAKLLDERKDAVLAYGHSYLIDDDNRVFGCTADYKDEWAKYADGDPTSMLLNGVSPVSSSVFYRREPLTRSPWNENAKLEDYELYVRLMAFGEFAFDRQVLSAWRHHSYNTSRNLMLMQTEVIAAQNRNAGNFGVERRELAQAQSRSKLRYARELLQNGRKREGLKLFKESWRAADSTASLGKPLAQLMLPERFLQFYQRKKREKQLRQYADLKL